MLRLHVSVKKFNKEVLLIAADVIRPAAIDQLQTLGKEIDTEVFTLGTETPAVETVRQGMEYAERMVSIQYLSILLVVYISMKR